MKIHDLIQGSPQWLAYRSSHFNASDAPAMMGCSPYKTRAQLLREMHTGVAGDIDIATQKRSDNGHRAEALARPLAEEFIGAELYPVTGSEGRLSASFDGLTLDESMGFEHKAMNDALRAAFAACADDDSGSLLPIYHRVQMEQQLLVSGAERVLFMASAWTAEDDLIEEQHCWYYPDQQLRQQIVDGWAQFEKDLAAFVLPDAAPEPARAEPMESLPAVSVRLDGALSVVGNLPTFAEALKAFIAKMPKQPATDNEFATCDAACKALKKAEEALDAAEAGALASISDVDAMRRAVADCRKLARETRLAAEKMVERRKVEIKEQAVMAARRALDTHIADLNGELAPMRLLPVVADFAGAIKGLRSFDSMQAALDTRLAEGKIAADAQARVIRGNVATFKEKAVGFEFLFSDLVHVVHKAADDFTALVQARVATHRAELERKRIEAEKADHVKMLMSELQGIEQQAVIAQIGRAGVRKGGTIECLRETLTETEAWPLDPAHWGEHFDRAQTVKAGVVQTIRNMLGQAEQAAHAAAPAPVNVAGPLSAAPQPAPGLAFDARGVLAPVAARAPRADEPATLKLGAICERLGFAMTAAFVSEALDIKPARIDGAARLYRPSDFARICAALKQHIERVSQRAEATA